MEDNLIYERYRELIIASLRQGLEDFLKSKAEYKHKRKKTQISMYTEWVMNCRWFDYLELNRELFLNKSLKMKYDGIKTIPSHRQYQLEKGGTYEY